MTWNDHTVSYLFRISDRRWIPEPFFLRSTLCIVCHMPDQSGRRGGGALRPMSGQWKWSVEREWPGMWPLTTALTLMDQVFKLTCYKTICLKRLITHNSHRPQPEYTRELVFKRLRYICKLTPVVIFFLFTKNVVIISQSLLCMYSAGELGPHGKLGPDNTQLNEIWFLCLRTEGAGGIMFPGCPSVRISRPDFFVNAITQVLLDGISSNVVQGSTTRSRWTD